jgi:hypothetical protein
VQAVSQPVVNLQYSSTMASLIRSKALSLGTMCFPAFAGGIGGFDKSLLCTTHVGPTKPDAIGELLEIRRRLGKLSELCDFSE